MQSYAGAGHAVHVRRCRSMRHDVILGAHWRCWGAKKVAQPVTVWIKVRLTLRLKDLVLGISISSEWVVAWHGRVCGHPKGLRPMCDLPFCLACCCCCCYVVVGLLASLVQTLDTVLQARAAAGQSSA